MINELEGTLKPRSHRALASTRQIKLMLKIVSVHTDRVAQRSVASRRNQICLTRIK